MRAFVLEGTDARLVQDYPEPVADGRFVRVKTLTAGVCNTDLELVRGYMGYSGVLGHEFVGEALDGRLKGRRVVGGINFGCGRCEACERGMARHCGERQVLGIMNADGVFADSFLIPEENLLEVPDGVDNATAAFAEPVAAGCEILDQLTPEQRGGAAMVLGDGKLGTLIAQVLAADGFAVTLVGRHLDTLGWIADAGVTLSPSVPDGNGFDLVVEATGSADGLRAAIESTKPRGVLVLKTTVAGAHEIDLAPVVINEISIIGSRCGRFEPALALLDSGRVRVSPLVSAEYRLEDMEAGFARAGERGVRKVLIRND